MKIFSTNLELLTVLFLFSLGALVVLAYGVRLTLKGPAHFDRVDKQGGSSLLHKGVMELAYWFFQPLGRFLIFCHISPNQISWASLILGFFAGLCVAFGHFGSAA